MIEWLTEISKRFYIEMYKTYCIGCMEEGKQVLFVKCQNLQHKVGDILYFTEDIL